MILNIRLIVPLDGLEGDRGSGVEALSQHSAKQLHENCVNLIIRVMTSDIYNLPWVSPCIAVVRIATWKMDFVESSFHLLCTLSGTSYNVCYVLCTIYFTLYTISHVLCTVCVTSPIRIPGIPASLSSWLILYSLDGDVNCWKLGGCSVILGKDIV